MGTAERRAAIMKVLCRRRHETIHNLAAEFGVSTRTIQRDIEVLSCSEPIFTQQGKYGGGVYVMDGYSVERMYMADREIALLEKLSAAARQHAGLLSAEEKDLLSDLILQYKRPDARPLARR